MGGSGTVERRVYRERAITTTKGAPARTDVACVLGAIPRWKAHDRGVGAGVVGSYDLRLQRARARVHDVVQALVALVRVQGLQAVAMALG